MTYFESCKESAKKTPQYSFVDEPKYKKMCECGMWAFRENFIKLRSEEAAATTWEQVEKCAAFARGESRNPYPQPGSKVKDSLETAEGFYFQCQSSSRESIPDVDERTIYCMCYTDFAVFGSSPAVQKPDRDVCWQVAMYRKDNGHFPYKWQTDKFRSEP